MIFRGEVFSSRGDWRAVCFPLLNFETAGRSKDEIHKQIVNMVSRLDKNKTLNVTVQYDESGNNLTIEVDDTIGKQLINERGTLVRSCKIPLLSVLATRAETDRHFLQIQREVGWEKKKRTREDQIMEKIAKQQNYWNEEVEEPKIIVANTAKNQATNDKQASKAKKKAFPSTLHKGLAKIIEDAAIAKTVFLINTTHIINKGDIQREIAKELSKRKDEKGKTKTIETIIKGLQDWKITWERTNPNRAADGIFLVLPKEDF